MKRGRNPITLAAVRDVLKSLTFNPNEPGPMAIISDNTDPKYWELRAKELIVETHVIPMTAEDANERIQLAARLLVLSLAERNRREQNITKAE